MPPRPTLDDAAVQARIAAMFAAGANRALRNAWRSRSDSAAMEAPLATAFAHFTQLQRAMRDVAQACPAAFARGQQRNTLVSALSTHFGERALQIGGRGPGGSPASIEPSEMGFDSPVLLQPHAGPFAGPAPHDPFGGRGAGASRASTEPPEVGFDSPGLLQCRAKQEATTPS